MNERIRELAEQAEQYAHELIDPNFNWNEQPRYFTEKFAELIVQECANVIADNEFAKDCDTFLMDSYAKGMRYSAHLIKEHFGVE